MSRERLRGDRGAAATEMAIIAIPLLMLLLLLVYAGRLAGAKGDIQSAARDGARAASLQRSFSAADFHGRQATDATLTARGSPCETHEARVDTSNFRAGGSVTVTVKCWINRSDLALLGIGPNQLVEVNATEVVDQYRGEVAP